MRVQTSVTVVLIAAVLGGCRDPGVRQVVGDVEVRPSRLVFQDAWVGHRAEARLTLHNESRLDRDVALSAPEGFEALPAALRVAGGATANVIVRFVPQEPGEVSAALEVRVGSEWTTVALEANPQVPPECVTATACEAATFDPAVGKCISHRLPDGIACTANACLPQGHCMAGACLGSAVTCDDGNPCTRDACDPTNGCVFIDSTASCPSPADPCLVAFCDPKTGCGVTDAPDGTACGPSDCSAARVCLSGSCQTTAVLPSGAPRWAVGVNDASTPAAALGIVTPSGGGAFRTVDGVALWPPRHDEVSSSLISAGSIWSILKPGDAPTIDLTRTDIATGLDLWVYTVFDPTGAAEVMLTQTHAALMLLEDPTGLLPTWSVREISATGTENFSCQLPAPWSSYEDAVLLNGRLVIRARGNSAAILSFDVGDRRLAAEGWVTHRGRPERSARPR